METEGATMATSSEAAIQQGARDRDPPPFFDGQRPELFKQYKRDLALWQWESEVPAKKHAVKVLRQLAGSARAAADEVPLEKIQSEDGVRAILGKLEEHFMPHLEAAMPKSFEKAVYGDSRKSKESIQDYIIRMDQAFKELKEESVELPEVVRGYIIFRQANLSQTQEDQVTTWTAGRYERSEVVRALRKLEKVSKDKAGKNYITEDFDFHVEDVNQVSAEDETDHDIENYVYVADGDLNQIFEEGELTEALATYQQVRKAIRDQRTARSWNPGKGDWRFNKGGSYGGKGGFRPPGKGSRIHVESLKLRTKCARCGQIGHWAKECSNPPDEHSRNKTSSTSSMAKSSMSGKSGFVQIGNSEGEHYFDHKIYYQFTLGEFLKPRKSSVPESPFCGISTEGAQGVVDTAAQSGLIGERALKKISEELKRYGLSYRMTNRNGQARGVGGEAVVKGVIELPIGIAGVNGVLEVTVVQEDVPLLLPVKLLRELQAVIDFGEEKVTLGGFKRSTNMFRMPSGHVTVSIIEFDAHGWQLPIEAQQLGLKDEDFRMDFTSSNPCGSSITHSLVCSDPWSTSRHVTMGALGKDFSGDELGCFFERSGPQGDQRCQSNQELEGSAGQGVAVGEGFRPSVGRSGRRGKFLARRWIATWLCAALGGGFPSPAAVTTVADLSKAMEQTRGVCGVDQDWSAAFIEEYDQACHFESRRLHASSPELVWGRESIPEGGLVPRMLQPVEGGDHQQNSQANSHQDEEWKYDNSSKEPSDPNAVYTVDHELSVVQCDDGRRSQINSVPVPPSCEEAHREEGGSHKREAFLPMQRKCVRFLRVGSGGTYDAQREGGDQRGQCQGADQCGGSNERSAEEGRRDSPPRKGLGTRSQGAGARGEESSSAGISGCQEDVGRSHEPCRCQAPRDSEGTAESIPGSLRADAEPDDVDHGSGWRGEDSRDLERPTEECRSAEEGYGDEEEHPANTGRGSSGSKDSGNDGRGGHERLRRWRSWRRDLTEEEAERFLKDAPWAQRVKTEDPSWETMRRLQWEGKYEPEFRARMCSGFWAREGELWKFHEGILPAENSGDVIVNEEVYEDEEADKIYGTMNRSSRKRLKKALNELKISEVFSEPRIAKTGKRLGLQQGTSFDIKTGFDFNNQEDRVRAWRKLQVEKPDLLILCPPCGPFSLLQEWNYPRMKMEKAMCMLGEGVEHLTFSMEMFEWQVMEGRWALFEHPITSRAWNEECVQRVLQLPGVQKVVGDQCQFQLQVNPEEDLNRKTTGFMTNSASIAKRLAVRCVGEHAHQPLVSGRAKKAEVYPEELCRAVVRGLKEENSQCCVLAEFASEDQEGEVDVERGLEEELDEEVERQGRPLPGRMIPAPEVEEDEGEGEPPGPVEVVRRGVSESDKRKIRKLHINLGHPSKEDFVRALRMARAREEVWKFVKEEFQCDLCKAHQKPTLNRPAAIPKQYEPGRTIGVDVVYFPGVEPNETIPVLNVTDWGSCYQALEPLDNVSAEEVWWKFMRCWGRVFGIPEVVIVDQGREFLGVFAQRVNESGAVVKTIGARAPHQQGRTERHGGLAKQMYLRMRDQVRPDNRREWETMIYAVEQAKNRLYNRSGFSPAQRQIGQNIRIPGSLSSDDPFEPSLVRQGASGEVHKLMAIRELAMEAFLKQTTMDAIKRAQGAKSRSSKEFHPGEVVYVYRRPLARRSVRGEDDTKRAQWVGPGTVILVEGPNVWISVRGEVWKCAREQVRSATMEEEEAFGLLKEELQELKEEINRRSSKRGFKDITMFGFPPEGGDLAEEDAVVPEPPNQRRRVNEEAGDGAQEPEQDPNSLHGSQSGNGNNQGEESSSSTSSSSETGDSKSREEPEGEKIEEQQMEEAVRSTIENDMLDGTMTRSAAEEYAPRRARLEKMRFKPYHAFVVCEDASDQEEEECQEGWYYEESSRCLIRQHATPRRGKFIPHHRRGCPIEVNKLKSRSWTTRYYDDGRQEELVENWRSDKSEAGPKRFWTGYSTFQLKPGVKEDEIKWHLLASKGSDEVKEEDISPEEWPQWKVADGEEWAKVSSTNAVRTLDLEESEEVVRQLTESGKLNRILPSRVVRRWKPACPWRGSVPKI